MRLARYKFDTAKRYFAWPVAAKVLELPSLGEVVQAVRVTLATPYFLDGGEPLPSAQLEAAVWAFVGEADDDKFLADAGIALSGEGGCVIPRWKTVCLWCTFGIPEGGSEFQALEKWDLALPTEYPAEPVVNATPSRTGLEFLDGDRVRHNGTRLELSPPQVQLLRVLDSLSPRYASVEQIRAGVTKWKSSPRPSTADAVRRADHAVVTAISQLRKILPAGLAITVRDKSNGWALIVDES